jgi:D-beta-D-heptose 7-phosphate kinase/D-beta-D-heptose 1-phosphate adenosyltransferase
MPALLERLSNWKPFTAVVVGDFMLDELVFGDVDRLCNDAPVPVLAVRSTEQRPGGAANVALDLVAMKARVHALGVVGSDHAALDLRARLSEQHVQSDGLIGDATRPTTVKRSLIGLAQHRHAQKMFRMDFESRAPIDGTIELAILERLAALLQSGVDVVCIEDYAKGVCTPALCQGVIRACRAARVPVLVDPAAIADYSRYRGASTITPNRTEAELAAGGGRSGRVEPAEFDDVARRLVRDLDLDSAVVTLDKHGALLLERDGEPALVPTVARKVYDVTGAGDMVLAALAAGVANGLGWVDAVRFANAAAGLEVEEFGVVPIPLERIHSDILRREGGSRGKLRTLAEAKVEVASARRAGQRIALTNGCFDVLHSGHVGLLDHARSLGDYLIVATNTDEKVREFKGPSRPVNNLEDRVRVLSGLASVDCVVVFAEDTPAETIEALRPDVLVKGDEYREDQIPGAAMVRSWGGEVVRVPMKPGASTTSTLRKMGDPRAEITVPKGEQARFIDDPTAAKR